VSDAAASDVRPLTAHEFDQFRRLAYDKFGLDLRGGKEQLVSARLARNMRDLHVASFSDYYRHVVEDRTGEALTDLIDSLTTNHTSFFREPAHFDFLRQTILPPLVRRDRIAVWSAACSSGEEPYSIVFSLLEALGDAEFRRVKVLATDISTRVLATAARGAYPADRCEGIAPQQRRRYLLRGEKRWRDWYRVKPELRAAVEFRHLNLMEPFPQLGSFPVIFCRNVMIYFDKPTQEALVERLAACLEPGGYLLIGHAESLNGVHHSLRYLHPAVYRKPETGSGEGRDR
jgi:chemotaxis protein methyltransferase CheR